MINLAEPTGSSTLAEAALWVQHTLTGSLATVVAIIAVAVIGFQMMAGQMQIRRGVTVVIGCFILFGAAPIASGLFSLSASGQDRSEDDGSSLLIVDPPPTTPSPPSQPVIYDPYAGASVPAR